MKTICKHSNILFASPGFQGLRTTGIHPIFTAPIDKLILQFPRFVNDELSKPERRLYFLALLNLTGLVDFKHYATPSDITINANIEPLLKVINWANRGSNSMASSLPRYAITKENNDLDNVHRWINAWWDAKINWLDTRERSKERTALLEREDAITKLIHGAYKNKLLFDRKLGAWSMDATGITSPELRKYWISIFTSKEPDLFNLPTKDIEELYEHLVHNLNSAVSIVAETSIRHIYTILDKNRKGLAYALDGDSNYDEASSQIGDTALFTVVSRRRMNEQKIADSAPTEEPKEVNYPTKIGYIVAKAKFDIAKRLKERDELSAIQKPLLVLSTHPSPILADIRRSSFQGGEERGGEKELDEYGLPSINPLNPEIPDVSRLLNPKLLADFTEEDFATRVEELSKPRQLPEDDLGL